MTWSAGASPALAPVAASGGHRAD